MLSEELMSVKLKKGEFLDQSLLIDGQAPKNEKELVALFASLSSSHLGFSIRKIRRPFPDCIAYRGGQRLRIEFEFQSRNFKSHHHRASGCDLIVCWHDNWGTRLRPAWKFWSCEPSLTHALMFGSSPAPGNTRSRSAKSVLRTIGLFPRAETSVI
jgi:hypothetical protein